MKMQMKFEAIYGLQRYNIWRERMNSDAVQKEGLLQHISRFFRYDPTSDG
jgi:hypothetical protein